MSGISDNIALFGATKQHATGPEHDKERHGMELLNKLNKRPKLTWGQKGSQKYTNGHTNIAKTQSVFRLSENWDMLKLNSQRHVYELDALTTLQVMARQAYIP